MQFCFAFVIAVNAAGAPTITQQPANAYVLSGQPGILSTTATGTGTITYQWHRDGWPVAGSTSATLSLPSVTAAEAGLYHCVITDDTCSTRTNTVRVGVRGDVVKWNATFPGPVVTSGVVFIGYNSYSTFTAPNVVAFSEGDASKVILSDGMLGNTLYTSSSFSSSYSPDTYYFRVYGFQNLVQVAALSADARFLALSADGVITSSGATCLLPAGLAAAASVSRSDAEGLALLMNGTVRAWTLSDGLDTTTVPTGLVDVVAISSGADHHLALKSDGSVVAWGDNTTGECDVPATLTGVRAISAGRGYSVALKADGTVVAWGGGGTSDMVLVPSGLTGVRSIRAGASAVFATKNDGSLVSWGNGNYAPESSLGTLIQPAQSGSSGVAIRPHARPEIVVQPASVTVREGDSASFSATVVGSGALSYQWFLNGAGVASTYGNAPYYGFNPVRTTNAGTIVLRVTNAYGSVETQPVTLTVIPGPYFTQQPSWYMGATAVGTGTLRYQWFRNGRPVPGATASALPSAIQTPGMYYVEVTDDVGTRRSLMSPYRMAGDLVAWSNGAGLKTKLTSSGYTSPVNALSSGDAGLAVTNIGVLSKVAVTTPWGEVNYQGAAPGQIGAGPALGSGSTTSSDTGTTLTGTNSVRGGMLSTDTSGLNFLTLNTGVLTLNAVNLGTTVVSGSNLVLGSSGGLVSSAANTSTLTLSGTPLDLTLLGSGFLTWDISALLSSGGVITTVGDPGQPKPYHYGAVALRSNRVVFLHLNGAVSANNYSATNWSPSASNSLPVPALSNIIDVQASGTRFLALAGDGNVTEWDAATGVVQSLPPGVAQITQISSGTDHHLALREDGTVVAWGDNAQGECDVPLGLANIVSIAAGADFSLALRSDGIVVAWGTNVNGESTVPVTLDQVKSISATYGLGCAERQDGSTVTWGRVAGMMPATGVRSAKRVSVINPASAPDSWVFVGTGSYGKPVITEQPSSVIVTTQGSFTLSVKVTSFSDYSPAYRWKKNGVVIPGATSSSYAILSALTAHAGEYSVEVAYSSSHFDSIYHDDYVATSAPAMVTVLDVPVITQQPVSLALSSTTASGNLTVEATCGLAYSCQWFRDGRAIPGATTKTLTIDGSNPAALGLYRALLSSSQGSRYTQFARVSVSGEAVSWQGTYLGGVRRGDDGVVNAGELCALSEGEPLFALTSNGAVTGIGHLIATSGTVPLVPAAYRQSGSVVQIAARGSNALVLTPSGWVSGWAASSPGLWLPANLGGSIDISISSYEGLALQENGVPACWTLSTGLPVSVPAAATGVTAIASGLYHHLALKEDGTVIAWGTNTQGQTDVPAGLANVTAIAAGDAFSIALKSDGTVVVWGNDAGGTLAVPTSLPPVVRIAAARSTAFVWHADGTSTAWGQDPGTTPIVPLPGMLQPVLEAGATSQSGIAIRARQAPRITQQPPSSILIKPGQELSIGLRWSASPTATLTWYKDGNVFTPLPPYNFIDLMNGFNPLRIPNAAAADSGVYVARLTNSLGTTDSEPVQVIVSDGPQITTQPSSLISQGGGGDLSVSSTGANGTVTQQWYRNGAPVAGATANTLHFDAVTPENEGVYHLRLTDSTGMTVSRLVRVARAGVLEAWTGAEDNIPPSQASRGVIQQPSAGIVVSALSTGPARLALLPGGSLSRILPAAVSDTAIPSVGGISPSISIQEAVVPPQIVNSDFVSVAVQNSRTSNGSPSSALAADGQKVLALRADGSVVAWDAATFQVLPVPHAAQGSVDVRLSETEALSLKRDGSVVCWSLASGTLLTPPSGLDAGVTAISSGKDHHLALKADGSVIAWGDNSDGESTVPAILASVRNISAGHDFSLALLQNGSVIAWGRNAEGQCDIPSGLTGVANLSSGEKIAIAVKSDGSAVAWGNSAAARVPQALSQVLTAGSASRGGAAFGIAIRQTFAPIIQISDTSVVCGQNEVVKLFATVSAAPRAAFQWQRNGVNVPGADQQNLHVRVSSAAELGSYRLVATNAAGMTTSEAVTLSLNANGPVFEIQPEDAGFLLGQRVTLESSATASANAGTLSYQWYRNGRAIPAATSSSFVIESAGLADAGDYQVRVNDASGSRRSRTARLRVRGSLRAWGFSSTVPGVTNDIVQTATGQYPIIALQSDGIVRTGGAFGVVPPPPEASRGV
ncbi:MAG: hypothetical protein RIS79_2767, partial [Verrucomicrobiota bacterium]